MITIIDYGMGNLGSILNMFRKIGVAAKVSSELNEIEASEKVVLPGVGAFDAAMERISASGYREALTLKAREGVPIMGVCLGMQLLMDSSEEGDLPGLCWIPGRVLRFSFPKDPRLKVPHMGWNNVTPLRLSPLTRNLPESARFYFVHSYYVKATDRADVVMQTTHGVEFDSVIQRGNIFGAQFHPEKSHKFGLRILENFAAL